MAAPKDLKLYAACQLKAPIGGRIAWGGEGLFGDDRAAALFRPLRQKGFLQDGRPVGRSIEKGLFSRIDAELRPDRRPASRGCAGLAGLPLG